MRIINENSDGNIEMLLVGGDEQYDGNTVTVSEQQSVITFEVYIEHNPTLPIGFPVTRGGEKCKLPTMKRDFYYPEILHIGGKVIRFYRHHSLSVLEAFIKLFNGYKGG